MFLESLKKFSPKEAIRTRAAFLAKARQFFASKGVLEVDCPTLLPSPQIDSNIDVIEAYVTDQTKAYLHTSPEYSLKKLLASGSGDIYYLGHVFRKNESGKWHSPEFLMAEWYRIGFSFEEMIQETLAFLQLFLGDLPHEKISYQKAFEKHLKIDPFKANLKELQSLCPKECHSWEKAELLDYLLSHHIEPHLGQNRLTVVLDYPADQAALAKTIAKSNVQVAERFEIYYRGIELTNGYHEVSELKALKRRFEEINRTRESQNKAPLPIDEDFLAKKIPACCGVSVGMDRVFKLSEENVPK